MSSPKQADEDERKKAAALPSFGRGAAGGRRVPRGRLRAGTAAGVLRPSRRPGRRRRALGRRAERVEQRRRHERVEDGDRRHEGQPLEPRRLVQGLDALRDVGHRPLPREEVRRQPEAVERRRAERRRRLRRDEDAAICGPCRPRGPPPSLRGR